MHHRIIVNYRTVVAKHGVIKSITIYFMVVCHSSQKFKNEVCPGSLAQRINYPLPTPSAAAEHMTPLLIVPAYRTERALPLFYKMTKCFSFVDFHWLQTRLREVVRTGGHRLRLIGFHIPIFNEDGQFEYALLPMLFLPVRFCQLEFSGYTT